MTTDAAVLDRTDAPETKAEDLDATKAPEGEDVQAEAQTGDESPSTTDTESKPDDHLAEIERERAEAEERLLNERAEAKALQLEKQRQDEARENARREKVKNAIPNALSRMGKLTESLGKLTITDAEGEPYSFNGKAFTNIIEGLGLEVEEALTEKVNASYDAAFAESLGQDALPEFWEAAKEHADNEGSVPVSALLDLHAERKALSTKAVKGMTLEQAVKASATVARELAAIKKAEFLKGKDDPTPAGEPDSDGTSFTRITYKDLQSMTRAQLDALPEGAFEKAMSGK